MWLCTLLGMGLPEQERGVFIRHDGSQRRQRMVPNAILKVREDEIALWATQLRCCHDRIDVTEGRRRRGNSVPLGDYMALEALEQRRAWCIRYLDHLLFDLDKREPEAFRVPSPFVSWEWALQDGGGTYLIEMAVLGAWRSLRTEHAEEGSSTGETIKPSSVQAHASLHEPDHRRNVACTMSGMQTTVFSNDADFECAASSHASSSGESVSLPSSIEVASEMCPEEDQVMEPGPLDGGPCGVLAHTGLHAVLRHRKRRQAKSESTVAAAWAST